MLRHGRVRPGGGQQREVWRGAFKRHLEGVVVHRLDAEVLELHLAVGDRLTVLDRIHRGDVLAQSVRVEHPRPAVDEVVGIDRRPVGPGDVLANREGELGAVLVLLPRLSHARDHFTGLHVDTGEAFEDIEEDRQFGVTIADTRVHGGRFGQWQAHHLLVRQLAIVFLDIRTSQRCGLLSHDELRHGSGQRRRATGREDALHERAPVHQAIRPGGDHRIDSGVQVLRVHGIETSFHYAGIHR